ncbi:MAG: class I SAM-dependent methyltransferase [Armatimonadetes bacterium]|nr:class I SAM-dependent methyltransferase [Armatimonadota bacterium]MDW8029724.1 class I SAM-dependent methyltransferase [Armatimonadota bacterium]
MTDWAKVWDETYTKQPKIYGDEPSEIAVQLANLLVQKPKPKRVLDLGCGYGRDSIYFAHQGFEVMALDCSLVALKMLRQRIAGTNLERLIAPIVADALQGLPACDSCFDAVYAYLFFCLAFTDADITKLLADCARVVKPKGHLAGTVRSIYDRSYGKGEEIEPDMFALPNAVRHFFSESYLERKLKGAGFELQFLKRHDETVGESHFNDVLSFVAQKA